MVCISFKYDNLLLPTPVGMCNAKSWFLKCVAAHNSFLIDIVLDIRCKF